MVLIDVTRDYTHNWGRKPPEQGLAQITTVSIERRGLAVLSMSGGPYTKEEVRLPKASPSSSAKNPARLAGRSRAHLVVDHLSTASLHGRAGHRIL